MEATTFITHDAVTTMNKCGIMPSELLEQRNELLEALKLAYTEIQHPYSVTPRTCLVDKIEKVISKCTGK